MLVLLGATTSFADKAALELAKAKKDALKLGISSIPEAYPYGPGDRSMRIILNKLPVGQTSPNVGYLLSTESVQNVEYWVCYSTQKSLVAGARVGSRDCPHGKATLTGLDNGRAAAEFIFPHTDKEFPNAQDALPRKIESGKTVHFKWIKKKGAEQSESEIVTFEMPAKLTIANFGDSFASGEGAPYRYGKPWDGDGKEHRSGNSGAALAVEQFKIDRPGVAVAFKNVASSGATVREGLIGGQSYKYWYEPERAAQPYIPQIDQVRSWMQEKTYDTLNIALISIGINDIGFGKIVADYFVAPWRLDGTARADVNMRNSIDRNIDSLAGLYTELKSGIDNSFNCDRVLVSEYPDLTHDQHGHFNGIFGEDHGDCWGAFIEWTSPAEEWELIYKYTIKLNNKIQTIVDGFPKWKKVTGMMEASKLHGLSNCDEPWFNTIGKSFDNQQDPQGTFHPNRDGHEKFVKPVILSGIITLYNEIEIGSLNERIDQLANKTPMSQIKLALNEKLASNKQLLLRPKNPIPSSGVTLILPGATNRLSAELRDKIIEQAKKLPKKVDAGKDNRTEKNDETP